MKQCRNVNRCICLKYLVVIYGSYLQYFLFYFIYLFLFILYCVLVYVQYICILLFPNLRPDLGRKIYMYSVYSTVYILFIYLFILFTYFYFIYLFFTYCLFSFIECFIVLLVFTFLLNSYSLFF